MGILINKYKTMILLIPLIIIYIKLGDMFMWWPWLLYYFLWAYFEEFIKNNNYIFFNQRYVLLTHISFWIIEWMLKITRWYWMIWFTSSIILHTIFWYITQKWLDNWYWWTRMWVVLLHFMYNYLIYLIQK